ncbi:MAG: CRISPR-associated endoribonuclease Cas6 [Salinivirgaceae bacterium]|nr:CRISPR-associated endoribonuclease Cas6 [Salinivirgaceae bacterium]
MDYQYYISAWIYKVLKNADKTFAAFLHDTGYGESDHKRYKLFCFSQLNFGKPIMWKEKKLFELINHEATLEIAFDVPEAASNFIKGLFMQQEFYLGDKFNGIDFKVSKVETLAEPMFDELMSYRLKSPWVISYKPEGRKQPEYLKPDHDLFNELSVKHLLEKFKNTRKTEITGNAIVFAPNKKYKRSGFRIKNGTENETHVVGNIFDFDLKAPIDVHKMLWNAGVSEKSSSGFGWVEVFKN